MLYRLMRSVSEWYALTVLWLYVAAFIIAFALVFVFPLGPIILLFLGLGGLGVVFVLAQALRWIRQWAARHAINHGVCPMCAAGGQARPSSEFGGGAGTGAGESDHSWRCERCGAEFSISGVESPAPSPG